MLLETINGLIVTAMKDKDAVRLNTLREIKTELMKAKTSGKEYTPIVETETMVKMVKRYKDAIEEFKAGNASEELINEYTNQLTIIKEFAPQEATNEDIIKKIEEIFKTLTSPSMKDMGKVITEVKKTYPTADGGLISKTFNSML